MIDIAGAIPTITSKLKKLPVGKGLDLRTYKRDRSVVILRTAEDGYMVAENGFEKNQFESNFKGLKKLLKTLLKREFPRSNKIRVYETTAGKEE
ncbi:hypothetical protein [Pseudodesulfovibrio sp. zrk46]|uniref:hypothetical protein n=1 Tax=Pseudodesulfovibrio sp. zrk46 TaxID=2725288 RepID=UPI001449E22F|nr:hypothetical protein [Pseudodesulfovibrio sp. zrk46]QJB55385.1 hypothetical protein HFN16_02795 [Pseudodesulfovibrio sp. zrk46]